MLLQLLADYDIESHNRLALIKVGVGLVVLIVGFVGALLKPEDNSELEAELNGLTSEELAKKIEESGKSANVWLNCIGIYASITIGRHLYSVVQNHGEQAGHIEMVLTYAVALAIPALICFALIRHRPLTVPLRNLRIATYLIGTSAFLMFAWAGLVLVADPGLWGGAVTIGAGGLLAAMTGVGFSMVRKIRRHINATLGDAVIKANETAKS